MSGAAAPAAAAIDSLAYKRRNRTISSILRLPRHQGDGQPRQHRGRRPADRRWQGVGRVRGRQRSGRDPRAQAASVSPAREVMARPSDGTWAVPKTHGPVCMQPGPHIVPRGEEHPRLRGPTHPVLLAVPVATRRPQGARVHERLGRARLPSAAGHRPQPARGADDHGAGASCWRGRRGRRGIMRG